MSFFDTGNARLGLLPAAKFAQETGDFIEVKDSTTISYPDEFAPAIKLLKRTAEDSLGLHIDRVPSVEMQSVEPVETTATPAAITFTVDPLLGPGGYRIEITAEPDRVEVKAGDLAGAHHGVQTLKQLVGPSAYRRSQIAPANDIQLPTCIIEDAPRFGWRGVMLDVARRFWSKSEILRYIDLIADLHFNILQLHLTDDQGWRFEVDEFPELTKTGSWRTETVVGARTSGVYDGRPHGGFYTRADLREIAEYARARGVEVIPEVDLPGHSVAAITAYPWLASDPDADLEVMRTWGISDNVIDPSPDALSFFKTVIDQLIEDMDPKYVGIGGDEVPTKNWAKRPDIVQRALDLRLTNPDGTADVKRLGGWFLSELAKHITAKGKRAVVWDDALSPDLPKDVIITVWHLDEDKLADKAIASGHDVVLAPYNTLYFDYPQSDDEKEPVHFGTFTTLDDVYGFEPVIAADDGKWPGKLLGAQAQLWGEYLNDPAMRDYNMFPRLPAFAEIAWSQNLPLERAPGTEAHTEFMHRLEHDQLPRLDAAGVAYRPLDGPEPWQQWPNYIPKHNPLHAQINMEGHE